MRLDKKLLLIAPTIVLGFVIVGMIYAAMQLQWIGDVGNTWKDRSDFIASVERGEKPLEQRQAVSILRYSLDVEAKRTEAIGATRELMFVLAAIAALACCGLVLGIRKVPREHWPRLGGSRGEPT